MLRRDSALPSVRPWLSVGKTMDCSLWVRSEPLLRAKEFKHLRLLFTFDGKTEREIDGQIGMLSAVMRAFLQDQSMFQPSPGDMSFGY